MKNYNIISKSKDGLSYVNQEAVVSFLKDKLNYSMSPVQGADNKFWLNGKYIENKFCEMMEGSRYYQLVLNRFDFGIECKGDYNAWSMAGKIKEEMGKLISEKKSA